MDEMVLTTLQHLTNVSQDADAPLGMRILALTEIYHLRQCPIERAQLIIEIDHLARNSLAKRPQQVQRPVPA